VKLFAVGGGVREKRVADFTPASLFSEGFHQYPPTHISNRTLQSKVEGTTLLDRVVQYHRPVTCGSDSTEKYYLPPLEWRDLSVSKH
jgi:hypothetical protein